jgi:predicted nuclease of restriction endonuclease-like (RecB) superfamily
MNTERILLADVTDIIEQGRQTVAAAALRASAYTFWQVGVRINQDILNNERADYGKRIVSRLATQLTGIYGHTYEARNLRRMMQFAVQFPEFEIVSRLATQLSWSHFVEVLPLKDPDAKLYYLEEAARGVLGRDGLRELIGRKAYERRNIANAQLSETGKVPFNVFKDPYLLDSLGLHDDYAEADLESAILKEIEKFILEFGKGFAFVERQKRMIIDGEDFHLDLLLFNRYLRRLVAVELKLGKFHAEYNGQMKLYLKWLNRYERQSWEDEPIGIILCSEGNREQIELLELDRDGIMVAEYWTTLLPKAEFEQRIHAILAETRERVSRRKLMLTSARDDGE